MTITVYIRIIRIYYFEYITLQKDTFMPFEIIVHISINNQSIQHIISKLYLEH